VCICGCAADVHVPLCLTSSESAVLDYLRRCLPPDRDAVLSASIASTVSLNLERTNFTYGEVHDATWLQYLNELFANYCTAAKTSGLSKFYDLGCGQGVAVFIAACSEWNFEVSVGVELLPDVIEIARQLQGVLFSQARKVEAMSSCCPDGGGSGFEGPLPPFASEVAFVECDLRKFVVPFDAGLVYVCSEVFSDELMHSIRYETLASLTSSTLIVTLKKPLPDTVQVASPRQVLFSWGWSWCFVARLPTRRETSEDDRGMSFSLWAMD